jgi:hypothetical protein
MKKLEILKKAVSVIVGIGTAKIIHEIIKNNVDTDSTYSKVTVTAASTAIGGAVSELTQQYTDRMIDQTAAFIQEIKNGKKTPETED